MKRRPAGRRFPPYVTTFLPRTSGRPIPLKASTCHSSRASSSTSARLSSSACVAFKPCGPSLMTTSRLPLTSWCVRDAETASGTIRSVSPWIDESRNGDLCEIGTEVGPPRRDAIVRALGRSASPNHPTEPDHFVADQACRQARRRCRSSRKTARGTQGDRRQARP